MKRFQNREMFWQIERRGSALVLSSGKRRSAGESETRPFDSEARAATEHDLLIAQKKRDGFKEVKVGPVQSIDRSAAVTRLLDDLRELGARVKTTSSPDPKAAIAAAEAALGFALPSEYRTFLIKFGQLEIELERTWFFYGLAQALTKTKEYATELGRLRRTSTNGYVTSSTATSATHSRARLREFTGMPRIEGSPSVPS